MLRCWQVLGCLHLLLHLVHTHRILGPELLLLLPLLFFYHLFALEKVAVLGVLGPCFLREQDVDSYACVLRCRQAWFLLTSSDPFLAFIQYLQLFLFFALDALFFGPLNHSHDLLVLTVLPGEGLPVLLRLLYQFFAHICYLLLVD